MGEREKQLKRILGLGIQLYLGWALGLFADEY